MKRGRRAWIALLILGALACNGGESGSGPRGGPVVLILVDTLNPDYLGTYGAEGAGTGTLDALAQEGVLFERAYAQAPYTLPSIHSILTGLYPQTHGVLLPRHRLDEAHTTLAEAFAGAGYATAGFVDGRFVSRRHGFAQGFEVFDDQSGEEHGAGFERLMPLIEDWLATRRDGRFFLFVHTYDVHSPYLPPREIWDREIATIPAPTTPDEDLGFALRSQPGQMHYARKVGFHSMAQIEAAYRTCIRYVDGELGRLFEDLRGRGFWEEATVAVTSDHGESFLDHGLQLGHGLWLYEESVRIPMIVKPPGALQEAGLAGLRVDTVVESIDLMPTLLELGRVEERPWMQGRSLLPLLLVGDAEGLGTSFGVSPNTGGTWYAIEGDAKVIGPLGWDVERVLEEHYKHSLIDMAPRLAGEAVGRGFRLGADPGERAPLELEGDAVLERLAQHGELVFRLNRERADRATSEIELSPEQEAELRALGYLGGEESAASQD